MKEYFYTITESMLNLGLRGTELNLFAIIFGYSQRGDGCCYASRQELAKRCGVSSKRTIDAALSALMDRGFIRKVFASVDGQIVPAFSSCAKFAPPCKNCTPPVQKLHTSGANSAPINIRENKDNKDTLSSTRETFVRPTVEEVAAYCEERRNNVDAETFVDFYTSKGWQVGSNPMKDWKAAVRTWENRPERKATTPAAPSAPRKSKADQAFDNMMELGKKLGYINIK